MKRFRLFRRLAALAVAGLTGASAFADLPPPRQPDPVSLDPASASVTGFGENTSDLFGENPPAVFLGFGWDVGGPGPIPHVPCFSYGLIPVDDTDAVSNNEFNANLRQFIYFSGSDASLGAPFSPFRNQRTRNQAAGDRYVTNGRTSIPPAAGMGGGPALLVAPFAPGARHVLSANQTRFNYIPSIPPPAFFPAGLAIDDMDGLEITPIDVNGDLRHDTPIYFSMAPGSPSLGAGSGAHLFVSPPGAPAFGLFAPAAALGLAFNDDVDALAIWDRAGRMQLNPGADYALFSLAPGSPSLAGPDGAMGTPDDFSAADIFVTNFTGAFRLFLRFSEIGMLRNDDVDGIDVEPAIRQRPEFFDWWVQHVNIDVPLCPTAPPPGANDFHVELIGIDPSLVMNPWTGSFPNATITPITNGTQINWTRPGFLPPGGIAHFGWTVMDDTQVQQVRMWYTLNGVQVNCRPIPDLVQRWRVDVDGDQSFVVDVLQNRSQDLVTLQRRAIMTPEPISLADLMTDSPLAEQAQLVDPQPVTLPPGGELLLPFPYNIDTRGYAVIYEVRRLGEQGPELAAIYLTAMSVEQSEPLSTIVGACCSAEGCFLTDRETCAQAEGAYLGDDSTCVECQGDPCEGFTLGDLNCDGTVNNFDIDPFVLALTNAAAYEAQYPNCRRECVADINQDGTVNNFDIDPFVDCLTNGGCQ